MYQLKSKKFNKKTPLINKIPFECPRCHWILRLTKPDNLHPIPLVAKPNKQSPNNEVLAQNIVCRNPRCQQSLTVFWSKPQDFYNRI